MAGDAAPRDVVRAPMIGESGAQFATALPGSLADWSGTDHYRVRRCIGTGGVGVVYEALDVERGLVVAVKRLRHFSPAALYGFKHEFRTLADVHHTNLVRLYELVATEDREVFFTMELVRGVDVVSHARPGGAPDFGRIRDALRQLVEGVQALHAAGVLHRDIKPSNVLVTPEGRVVLLDFGVATELARARDADPDDEQIVGTASYMAPEQAVGDAPTPASDWYAVGALLFETLVGRSPFDGSIADVLRAKSSVDAPSPSVHAAVPADLGALCSALLARSAEARPDGPTILRRIGAAREAVPRSSRPAAEQSAHAKLAGRQEQLVALRDAFDAARAGRTVTVNVCGGPGMGKSSLVHEFLEGLVAGSEAVVLRGRTYERESIPYKAIDGWVDVLSRHLFRLSDRGTPVELPEDVWPLARLFPVLRRVPEIADVRESFTAEPHGIRRRAFAALRELLRSLAKTHPVVIHADDVHWGDADSAALLLELVRPPHAPPLLLVMTYRQDEADASPLLTDLRAKWPEGAEARDVAVGPLAPEDAVRLAVALLGADDVAARATAEAVARESRGSPFLVEELVRAQQGRGARAVADHPVTLEASVAERVAQLPEEARRLLEAIAVSGRPLAVQVVCAAVGLDSGRDDALALLTVKRFVRVGLRNGRDVAETVNDRIQGAIVGGIPPERARSHRLELARVLESSSEVDPDAVAILLVGAGEKRRAVPYAERAADRAIAKVAFDRAVQLLRIACEGCDGTDGGSAEAQRLHLRLAEVLAWAGRGAEAARQYLRVAASERGAARVQLERAAAEQLLASGRIDEGGQVLHGVLEAIGMRAPDSKVSALFWLFVYRVRLMITGLRFQARAASSVRSDDRARIDAMYAVAMGFAVVDVLLGACMQARLLLESLRAGDADQITRAAALEAAQLATLGGSPGARERALFDLAQRLAGGGENVVAQAVVDGARGVSLFLRGHWKEAREALDGSISKLPPGRNHWYTNATLFGVRSLYFSGHIKELVRRQGRAVADAQDRGDLYTTVNFAATTTMTIHLAADDPEGARTRAREGMAAWSQTGFLVQHFQAMTYEPDIDLYIGDGAAAYDRVMRDLPALRRSMLLHVQFVRGSVHYARGRCAVAAVAARPGRRRRLLAEARGMARRLERERMPWTTALGALVRAAAENEAGGRSAAIASLRVAVDMSVVAGMAMHAAAARCRLGELLGGSEGSAMARAAHDAIAAEGIRNPARWVAIYLPGVWTAPSK
jgi:serine/threonine protein kinase